MKFFEMSAFHLENGYCQHIGIRHYFQIHGMVVGSAICVVIVEIDFDLDRPD